MRFLQLEVSLRLSREHLPAIERRTARADAGPDGPDGRLTQPPIGRLNGLGVVSLARFLILHRGWLSPRFSDLCKPSTAVNPYPRKSRMWLIFRAATRLFAELLQLSPLHVTRGEAAVAFHYWVWITIQERRGRAYEGSPCGPSSRRPRHQRRPPVWALGGTAASTPALR